MANDEPSDKDVETVRDHLERAWKIHEQRNAAPYDGVLGTLPEWVPEWHKREFLRIRNQLLDNGLYNDQLTPSQILDWIETFCSLGEIAEGAESTGYIPPEITDDIGRLAHYRYASSLDPEEGLKLLAGETAVQGYKSVTAHQQRDDYHDKLDCQEIAKQLWKANPDLTITQLEISPELAAYARKYKGRHTLRDWLKPIDPRPPGKKRGRRPRK